MRDIRNDELIIREISESNRNGAYIRTSFINSYYLHYEESRGEVVAIRCFDGSIMPKSDLRTVIDGLTNFIENEYTDDDIANWNDQIRKSQNRLLYKPPSDRKERDSLSKSNIERGYVYFIKEEFSETIKIGKTKDISDRSRIFSVKLPFRWDFIKVIESEDYSLTEVLFHRKFADKRIHGEWFDLDEKDIASIISEEFDDVISQSIKGEGNVYD